MSIPFWTNRIIQKATQKILLLKEETPLKSQQAF